MNAPVNELQVLEQNVIVAAFAKRGGTDELFDRIAQEARSFVPDTTTKKGRDAIGSVAMKVSKSKTLTEKYAKDLVAEEKARIKLIDDDRIQFCKKMDALRDEILAPRDAWEQAEKDRVEKHECEIGEIRGFANIEFLQTATVEMIKGAIACVDEIAIDSSFDEYEQQAKITKFETMEALRNSLVAREKYEAEQAELERLRKEEQDRLQRERDERIAKEAADKATREAEEKARFEAERVQREKAESEQREARLIAEKEAAELRAKHAAQEERERAEREKAAKAEAERQAEAERLSNIEHMRSINSAILNKLCEIGLDEGQAKAVITAIAKNQIPNVSIKY